MGLDLVLSHASPNIPLEERLEWLMELFQWLRAPGKIEVDKESHKTGIVQATRIRYLLLVLERNPEWKSQTSLTLQSILKDTNSFNLFCATGLPTESSFFSELLDRLTTLMLPLPPHHNDLAEVFSRIFTSVDDIHWLQRLDSSTLAEIWSLFAPASLDGVQKNHDVKEQLSLDMEESLLFLTGQVRTYGLEPKIRKRMSPGRIQSLPFFEITFSGRQLIEQLHSSDLYKRREAISHFREIVFRCKKELGEAYTHLDEFGVSVAIVYQLDRINALLNRIEVMVRILTGENQDPQKIVQFLCNLIIEIHKQKSIKSLLSENLSLLSMKIAQRSAETGSNYIAPDRTKYFGMFSKASGGGLLTAFTALIKLSIETLKDSAYFFQGLLTSLNYSISFVWIYLAGFTLATKQPAMTANALAEKMQNLELEESKNKLVDEIINLIRSQVAATLGNLSAVIPTVVAVDLIVFYLSGDSVLTPKHGIDVLSRHSAFGLSPVHAAFTGVLLWMSSIIAGWVDNWSAYHELPQSIVSNRRLKWMFTTTTLSKVKNKLQKHLAPIAGNISLGFLLGMSPKILGFFGIPLDIRHVTLSAGVITYASSAVGFDVFSQPSFWLAILGLISIGIMNISVSFFLALFVALRSRRIESVMRDTVYSLVWKKFLSNPISFFWFPKEIKVKQN